MKQKLLVIAIAIAAVCGLCSTDASAQNANRNGWIIELQGGKVVNHEGGFLFDFDFGYRWATSLHWAVEAKVGVGSYYPDKYAWSIMPGVRYTSKELFSNCSLFTSFNAGLSTKLFYEDVIMPLNLCVGLNIGNRFNIGASFGVNCLLGYYCGGDTTPCGIGLRVGVRI